MWLCHHQKPAQKTRNNLKIRRVRLLFFPRIETGGEDELERAGRFEYKAHAPVHEMRLNDSRDYIRKLFFWL